MNRLFWGLFFVLIDWKVTMGSAVFDLLPDFVGFFLLMRGMESMAEQSAASRRGRHLAFGMMLFSMILYGMELMNPDISGKLLLWSLGLAGKAVTVLVLLVVIRGIREAVPPDGQENERLRMLWIVVSVLEILAQLAGWIPVAGKVCTAAALIGSLCFLTVVFRCVKKQKKI